MKKWLLESFLPMWAKETVLADNRALVRKKEALQQENRQLRAYIRGLHTGLRKAGRSSVGNGGNA